MFKEFANMLCQNRRHFVLKGLHAFGFENFCKTTSPQFVKIIDIDYFNNKLYRFTICFILS